MDGIGGLTEYAAIGCFAAAFALEFALKCRPFVVAFLTPPVVFVALTVWLSWALGQGLKFEFDRPFLVLCLTVGIPASLIGSGLARGLRIGIEAYRLRLDSRS